MSARLRGLLAGDRPEDWEALGFSVAAGHAWVGGIGIALDGRGGGLRGWSLDGMGEGDLDGLPAPGPAPPPPATGVAHPNGARLVDHVVALTDDLDRTVGALRRAGLDARRVREAGRAGTRQAFYALGPCLLELVGPVPGPAGARLWGLAVVVDDLDGLARRLGERLGPVHDAVQPGRRIASLRRPEGAAGAALAFMSPR